MEFNKGLGRWIEDQLSFSTQIERKFTKKGGGAGKIKKKQFCNYDKGLWDGAGIAYMAMY